MDRAPGWRIEVLAPGNFGLARHSSSDYRGYAKKAFNFLEADLELACAEFFKRRAFAGTMLLVGNLRAKVASSVLLRHRENHLDSQSIFHWPPDLTNLSHIHSKRRPVLVPQPVPSRLRLVSKISTATVSVNSLASRLSAMARVSLCVCIQAPAGLKTKASDTAL